MPEENQGGMGHNNPPAYDTEVHAELASKVDDFMKATQAWLNLDKIETEEQAGLVTDQIDGLRGLYKNVDTERKTRKKPHDNAGTEVQTAFNPLLTKLKMGADSLKSKLAEYASAQEAKAAAEKAAAEAEAKRLADEAEAERLASLETGDISAQVDADEKAAQAEVAQKAASAPKKTNVKSATGAGRTMSLRTVKEVEVTNLNVLYMALRDEPEVAALLTSIATRRVRAAGYDEGKPLPGIKVNVRSVMA